MNCTYQNNSFCSKLDLETLAQLCNGCHIKRYAKGQHLFSGYWKNSIVLLLDGMMAMVEPDANDSSKIITTGIASGGDLISGLVCAHTRSIRQLPA